MKKNNIRIFHFSDTHTCHEKLVPPPCDISIFSGDCSNPKDTLTNMREVRDFLDWYQHVPAKYKIFVAGNHDVSIERGFIQPEEFSDKGIIYLENDWVEILGLKIWGSPVTPSFGNGWAWNKPRHKLYEFWEHIPEGMDIIVTHGPPKGVLDLTINYNGTLEVCGCAALSNVLAKRKPKLVCFGHIHNRNEIHNSGVLTTRDEDNRVTIYSNGTIVEDGKLDGHIISQGNWIEL